MDFLPPSPHGAHVLSEPALDIGNIVVNTADVVLGLRVFVVEMGRVWWMEEFEIANH